ncbi:MFS transporter, partial [Noviherbaspirillum denitrificans]
MKPSVPRPSASLLLTVFLLTALEFLQSGMIAFAAGPIMGHIGAAPEEYSLAAAGYACVAVMTISKQRWLVERLGWRRFVQFSLLLFIIGSLVCATSTSYAQFLAGRLIMGLGGAAFMTSGRVIVNLIPP